MKVLKETSCCCLRLGTGSLIIGILYCVFSALAIYVSIASINELKKGDIWNETTTTTNMLTNEEEATPESKEIAVSVTKGTLYSQIAFAAVQVLLSIVLVIGTVQHNSALVIPWVVWNTILAVLEIFACLIAIVTSFIAGLTAVGIGFLIGGFIIIGIHVYLLLVVYSYYKQLKSSRPGAIQGVSPGTTINSIRKCIHGKNFKTKTNEANSTEMFSF